MTNFMDNFLNGQTNGHAVKSPVDELAQLSIELVQLRQRIETLQAGIRDAMDRVVMPENVARMAKAVLVKKGYKTEFTTKDKKAAGGSRSPVAAIFGTKTLSRRQTETCMVIFGDRPFCRGEGPAESKTTNIVYRPIGGKMTMRQWNALVELLGPDQALVFKSENGFIVESDE